MTNPMTHLDAYADEELQQVLDRILAQARGEVLGIRDTWKRFIAISEAGVLLCVWAWKPVGTHAGLNGCWESCSLSCGLGMHPRSAPSGCGSRRRIARTRS